jgi:hypothetical protein
MTRTVTEVARGSHEISANIQAVAGAAEGTTRGASDAKGAADELATMAIELQKLVSRFRHEGSGDESSALTELPQAEFPRRGQLQAA